MKIKRLLFECIFRNDIFYKNAAPDRLGPNKHNICSHVSKQNAILGSSAIFSLLYIRIGKGIRITYLLCMLIEKC